MLEKCNYDQDMASILFHNEFYANMNVGDYLLIRNSINNKNVIHKLPKVVNPMEASMVKKLGYGKETIVSKIVHNFQKSKFEKCSSDVNFGPKT